MGDAIKRKAYTVQVYGYEGQTEVYQSQLKMILREKEVPYGLT